MIAPALTAVLTDPQALFFDFDGVLADSVHVKTEAFGALYAEYGDEMRAQVVAHHLANGGMSRFDKFRHYEEDLLGRPMTEARMDELCARFARLVVDKVVAAPEIPGAEAYLRAWCGRVPCFVISATPEAEIREIVRRRGLDDRFAEVCGAPTKKADHVARLLRERGFRADRCVFFGDAESDCRAAEANKVPFCAVLAEGNDSPLASHEGLSSIPNFRILFRSTPTR